VVGKHFCFSLSNKENSGLSEVLGYEPLQSDLAKWKILDISRGMLYNSNPIKPVRRFQNETILNCDQCELGEKCKLPVLPSPGIFNVFITGEAPGPQEDEHGRGFYEQAPAGELLWKELALYGLVRRIFFINNICRCYPGRQIRTPGVKHIDACRPWFEEEINRLQPRLILGIGNTCVKAFTGKDGGIQKLSGTTEWMEHLGAWVCWCLHPAAVKRASGNREYFSKGIRNFASKFALLKPITAGEIEDDIPF